MILRIHRLQIALQMLACTVLAAALASPLGATAATSQKSSAKGTKPMAVKVADKKRAVSVKTVAGGPSVKTSRKQQSQLAKASNTHGKTRATLSVQSGKSKVRLAQKGKKALVAQNARMGKGARFARNVHQRAKVTMVAHSRPALSVVRVMAEPRLSTGERLGLRGSQDALELNSSVALVVDQDTSEVLFSKNDTAVLPIASLTKLMTGLVIADANLPMDEMLTIDEADAEVYRNSRLAVGTTLSRGELMHLALMSSENRAANALGRTFPGGSEQFVLRMNAKARELGMRDTRYVEPTGLSSQNQSSARDLATLVSVAYERPILRSLSTSPSHQLALGTRTLQYNNSNRLIRNPDWDIGLQKTGYISEAGRCLVMQAKVAGRKLIMVFLDSAGKLSRAQDAERVRRWVEAQSYQQLFVRPQG
jgi:D-alanyl-D-alanine endopeptidase (penicillin-binding protein 7)